jgi:hypothetical protein
MPDSTTTPDRLGACQHVRLSSDYRRCRYNCYLRQRSFVTTTPTILAVAIETLRNLDIDIKSPRDLEELRRLKVRPYLRGRHKGLAARGRKLGDNVGYKFHFRQRSVASLIAPRHHRFRKSRRRGRDSASNLLYAS